MNAETQIETAMTRMLYWENLIPAEFTADQIANELASLLDAGSNLTSYQRAVLVGTGAYLLREWRRKAH